MFPAAGIPSWGPPMASQMQPPPAIVQDTRPPPPFPPQPRPVAPPVAGFQKKKPAAKPLLQPWMLVAGAILVAILAFVITRAFIS